MSGTGKTTALSKLRARGFRVVDTDVGGWTVWSDADGGYVWREERIEELLAHEQEPMLYCPVCSKRLSERKCKLFCEQCGYYMSCADYY